MCEECFTELDREYLVAALKRAHRTALEDPKGSGVAYLVDDADWDAITMAAERWLEASGQSE